MDNILNIPLGVREMYAPFILPKGKMKDHVTADDGYWVCDDPEENEQYVEEENEQIDKENAATEAKNNKPQFFSFRGTAESMNSGRLNIFPQSVYRCFTNDISYRLLYNRHDKEAKSKGSVSMSDFLHSIPCIQIREYQQESKINQAVNFFKAFSDGWNMASDTSGNAKSQNGDQQGDFVQKMKDLKAAAADKAKKMGAVLKEIFTPGSDFMKALTDMSKIKSGIKESYKLFGDPDSDMDQYVLLLPYALYYNIITTMTQNMYEIPYSGSALMKSDGMTGWTDTPLGGFSTDGNSLLGMAINYLGKNFKINMSPTWDGPGDGEKLTFTVEFDLYNDTLAAAVMNFVFIQTIFSHNLWMQYHLYQHSPSLYDIKIDGYGRYYMCAGKFECTYKGVMRNPSDEFIDELSKYKNEEFGFDFDTWSGKSSEQHRHNLRIPDIYAVKLEFQSLLPNNLNNYLYSFTQNNDIQYYEYDFPDDGRKYGVLSHLETNIRKAGDVLIQKWAETNSSATTQPNTDEEAKR